MSITCEPPVANEQPDPFVQQAVAAIRREWPVQPVAAIILGTGLGSLAEQIYSESIVPYEKLAGLPCSTATGHRGRFVCGTMAGKPVIAMEGRCHFYEGYTAQQITLPVRIMRELGAELLIVSNASGGLNPHFKSGDIMAVADHLNFMGARTAELTSATVLPSRRGGCLYDSTLLEQAESISRRHGFACHRGVYIGVLGPNYETRAEYRFMRRLGGDAVGMSTVPEVLVASQLGMRVLALSTITNVARPDIAVHVDAQEVIDMAETAEPRLRHIVCGVLSDL